MTGVALADVNVLVALAWPNHDGHAAARTWFAERGRTTGWATTPITEVGFIRVSSNRLALPLATSPENAAHVLRGLCATGRHEFWPDDLRFAIDGALLPALRGHKQVTDAHLLSLARHHAGRLVTFDRALAQLAGDHTVELLTVERPSP